MIWIFFLIGTCLGCLVGIAHALEIHHARKKARVPEHAGMTMYRCLWTLGLWTLFGGYLLFLWFAGGLLWLLVGTILRRRRVA